MLREIFRFEGRYQLRQPLFWICFGVFALLGLMATSLETVQIGEDLRHLHANAPFVVVSTLRTLSIVGLFLAAAFCSGAVLRDAEFHTDAILFSTGLGKRDFLLGRFLAAYLVTCLAFLGAFLGAWLGTHAPWLPVERLGVPSPAAFAYAALAISLPNLFVMCALMFCLAVWTRSTFATYLAGIALVTCTVIAGATLSSMEWRGLGGLLDPLANATLDNQTRYWTVFEKNTLLPPFLGPLALNRGVWLLLSLAALALTFARFRFTIGAGPSKKVQKPESAPRGRPQDRPQPVFPRFTLGGTLQQIWSQTRLEVASVIKTIPFLAATALLVINVATNANFSSQELYGVPVHPSTRIMFECIRMSSELSLLVVIIYYGAELVWRERHCKLHEIADALPMANSVLLIGKMAALGLVVGLMLAASTLTTLAIQTLAGHRPYELGVYAVNVGYLVLGYLILAVYSVFLQVALNQKYLAMGALILLQVGLVASYSAGFDDSLLRPGELPYVFLSDMGGAALFAPHRHGLVLYWGAGALLLLTVAHLLYVRGRSTDWGSRLRIARGRLTRRVAATLGVLAAGMAGAGGYVHHNTHVLNRYRNTPQREAQRAAYEKTYAHFADLPQPKIVDIDLDVDLRPATRTVVVRGRYLLKNRTAQALSELHVHWKPQLALEALTFRDAKPKLEDRELGYAIYTLARPLEPQEEAVLEFTAAYRPRGFENKPTFYQVLENGTFLEANDLPGIGFAHRDRLKDPAKRAEQGLPPLERIPKLGDPKGLNDPYYSPDAEQVHFRATLATAADQTALSVGELKATWAKDGRRFFRYEMQQPIWKMFPLLSARYSVRKAAWKQLPIEVYFHPDHAYNVDRMIAAVQRSLDYYTQAFGPYPFASVRIVEFPNYQGQFAQAFPGVIPFSESAGFVADLRDPERIDHVFDVTAHEIAHQWWGHEVVGATVQGASLLVETLAQYSALMVSEKEYGRDQIRKYLRYELDQYLRGRGGEKLDEMPLKLVEMQSYLHYFKGSLAMYALREYMGEERINQVLKAFVTRYRTKQPPYPTSVDLIRELRAAAPPECQGLITDLFERIVLFDFKTTEATYQKLPSGKYQVTLRLEARKYEADGQGREHELPLDERVEVGIFAAKEKPGREARPLHLAKYRLQGSPQTLRIEVDEVPATAGLDPRNLLIDRNPGDNRKAVALTTR